MDCTEPKIELPGPDCDGFYRWREWVIARGVTSNRWVIRTAGGKYLAGSYDTPEAAARALTERGYGPGAKAKAEPEGARWEHGQEHALFLGRDGELDLWFSKTILKGQPGVFCVTRVGAVCPAPLVLRPGEYAFPPFATARRLARERGLLPEPKPSLPDGYDAAKIPAHMEWTGECRLPRKGELFLGFGDYGLNQADRDFTGAVRPILRHKPLPAPPPTPATLSYRDAWPTPKAAGPEPKENPMPPKDEVAPQGRALTTEEFDQMVELAKTFRCDDGPAWDAPVNALEAHARWLHFQVDPSAEFDEPAPNPEPPSPPPVGPSIYTLGSRVRLWHVTVAAAAGSLLLSLLQSLAPVAKLWLTHLLTR